MYKIIAIHIDNDFSPEWYLQTMQSDLFQLLQLEIHWLKEQRRNVKELNRRILKKLKQNQLLFQ